MSDALPDATVAHQPAAAEAGVFKGRLAKLVVKLLSGRISTPEAYWQLELDLLALERDLQSAITRRKAVADARERGKDLDHLRQALWHARRFGDALAWTLFRAQRRQLYPLSENHRTPVLPDGDGSRGMIAGAQGLYEQLGFPLLHDITDLLRVGDVTFFERDGLPQTVEIKTQVVDSKSDGKNTMMTYRVTVIAPSDGIPPAHNSATTSSRSPATQPALASERFHRQLKRMTEARAIATAEIGKPAEIAGVKTLMIEGVDKPAGSRWPLLRRLVRRAKQTGYASGVADDEVLLAAIYDESGIDSSNPGFKQIRRDLLGSGIFLGDREKNDLLVSSLPDSRGNGPHRYVPYYLYSLPRTAIVDMLFGRLVIISVLNAGKVVAALEDAGLRIQLGAKRSIRVFTEIQAHGGRYQVELPSLQENLTEMIMEAMPISYVVGMAVAMAKGAAEQAPLVLRDPRDATVWSSPTAGRHADRVRGH